MKFFEIEKESGGLRRGKIRTKNGELETPFFMPDATRGFVRSLDGTDLAKAQVRSMVVNTYHLFLNPGEKLVKKTGGIHDFMNFPGPLLSDSGGYQVFSLIHKNPKMGKITDEGAIFRSPLNGTLHKITPEKSIQIQFDLGVDMLVVLDDPAPNFYPKKKIELAVERTIGWAERSKREYEKQLKKRKIKKEDAPFIFGVIQGGKYLDLRKRCADELVKIGFHGLGFGARHIDEDGKFMEEVLRETANFIPRETLRFALGMGTPEDIIRSVRLGWDMFDCVIPTREGRHGRLFVRKAGKLKVKNEKLKVGESLRDNFYKTLNINNGKFRTDFSPVDNFCDCALCSQYSRAYLYHLFSSKDPLGARLASIHNLRFYMDLMAGIRQI